MIKYCILTVGILALSACASSNSESGAIGSVIKSRVAPVVAARKAARSGVKPVAAKPFTTADAAKVKAKLIRVQVPKYKSSSLATLRAKNNGYTTFATSGGQTVTLNGGSLTATRGLRDDLVARSLGRGERTYKHLNSLNNLTTQTFKCSSERVGSDTVKILDRSYKLTKIEEICRNEFVAFKNVTWVSASGAPRKSQQWIGSEIGHVIIEWLN